MNELNAYVKNKNSINKLLGGHLYVLPRDAKKVLEEIESDLSPENLTCDGELPLHVVRKKYKFHNQVLDQLNMLLNNQEI